MALTLNLKHLLNLEIVRNILSIPINAAQAFFFNRSPRNSTIIDESGSGTARPQQPGRAYLFDRATLDYLLLDSAVNLAGDFCMSAWFNTTDLTLNSIFNSTSATDNIRIQSTTEIMVSIDSSSNIVTLDTVTLLSGQWYHLMVERSGTTVSVYIDGLVQASTTTDSSTFNFERVGLGVGTTSLDGSLFDIRVYNDVLTAAEKKYVYTFGDYGTDPGIANLELQYKCDDTHATIAYDSSGNASDSIKTNIVPATFHYEGGDVPYSFQNEVGWSPVTGFINDVPSGSSYSQSHKFDGVDDLDTLDSHISEIDVGADWSLSFWMKLYDLSASNTLVFSTRPGSNGVAIMVSSTMVRVLILNPSSPPTYLQKNWLTPTTGTWNHIAATWEDSTETIRLYIDGVEKTDTTVNVGAGTGLGTGWGAKLPLALGTNCQVSDGRVYSVEKSPAEITALAAHANDTTSLTYHCPFNGDFVDLVGANNGTLTGGPNDGYIPRDESNTTNDVLNESLNYTGRVPHNGLLINSACGTFDGINDYADITGVSTTGTSYTITMLVNSSVTGTSKFLYDQDPNRLVLAFLSTTTDQIGIFDGTWREFGAAPNDGAWHHLAFVFDGALSKVRLYIDGVQLGIDQTLTPVAIGGTTQNMAASYIPSNYLAASIANFRIYDGILTQDEVLYDYNGTGTATGEDIVGYWPIAEGNGTAIYDVSGNDNHGAATAIIESTFWGTTQDLYHYNIVNGFEHYDDDATGLIIIRPPYKTDGTQITPTISGYTKNQDNPDVTGHNDAETQIDFTDAISTAPWSNHLYYGGNFDGVDYITLPVAVSSVVDGTLDFSGSLLFRHDSNSGTYVVFGSALSGSNMFAISVTNGTVRIGVRNGGWASRSFASVVINQWHELIWSYVGGVLTATVDGVASTGINNPTFSSTASCKIGSRSDGLVPFLGDIQNIVLVNASDTIMASYLLNGNACDASVNGYHGIISGTGVTFPITALETAYGFGDTRDRPNFKTVDSSVQESQFYTEG